MKFINLSLRNLRSECKKWAKVIDQDYQPDAIVFVAKAGFLIAEILSEEMNVPMFGVETVREKGNKIKNIVAPIIRLLPNVVRNLFIMIELASGIHSNNSRRNVRLLDERIIDVNNILVVDDSVDTGASIVAVVQFLKSMYPKVNIKIAALNVWEKSKEVVEVDFALYKNTVIKAPMSKDSKEYDEFVHLYEIYLKDRK